MSSLFDPFNPIGNLERRYEEPHVVVNEDGTVEPPRDPLSEPPVRPTVWLLRVSLVFACMVLAGRLIGLQVVQGAANRVLAEGNRVRSVEIQAPRGLITDRHGTVLATNQTSFALEVTPADLSRDKATRRAVYETLASVTKQSVDDIQHAVESSGLYSLQPLQLMSGVSQPDALAFMVQTHGLSGVSVVEHPIRHYTSSNGLAHVLGYTGLITKEELEAHPDYPITSRIGKLGVEATYDAELRGIPGTQSVEVDAEGVAQRTLDTIPATPGKTVELGIDAGLQKAASDALQDMITKQKAAGGVVVGIDPRDGTIRAMVSLPSYDDNVFSNGISSANYAKLVNDPTHPFTNRAIAGVYPPGSTIKPLIATGGLADGVITKDTTIDAPASIEVNGFVFPDWKRHGIENVTRALAVSSDVFFYAVGGGWDKIPGLGIERLDHHYALFGLGQPTAIDMPGEQAGLLPTPDWKQRVMHEPWYIGDTYHISIGQGDLLMTPLQLAQSIATVANGGIRYQPHMVEATVDPRTNTKTFVQPVVQSKNFEPSSAIDIVRQGMLQTVQDGSGRGVKDFPFQIGGKTGTAQFGTEDKTHAWFVSFAPYDNPKLALVILVEGGGDGDVAAVPVAHSIYQWVANHGFDGEK